MCYSMVLAFVASLLVVSQTEAAAGNFRNQSKVAAPRAALSIAAQVTKLTANRRLASSSGSARSVVVIHGVQY